jgi:anti-sigma B factor antagonist
MRITQENRADVVILRLSGQLVGGPDADAVRDTIQANLAQGRRKILIDLHEVSWVNSTGLGTLISGHMNASREGGQLILMRASRRIDSIFEVTRLDTVFQIYRDEDSALQGIAG